MSNNKLLAGRYELIEKIGDGGMAVVYKAKDRLLNRYVAVKILRPEFTRDAQFIESFRKESQAAAGLQHPNIVNVYDVGKEGNIYFIVSSRHRIIHLIERCIYQYPALMRKSRFAPVPPFRDREQCSEPSSSIRFAALRSRFPCAVFQNLLSALPIELQVPLFQHEAHDTSQSKYYFC